MITVDGRRLFNSVLANRDSKIATHIALGINTVYDATVDGSPLVTTHNRFHSPYIVDEIPIVNTGIVTGTPDQIVFSGQSQAAKYFMANNMGLVSLRFAGEVEEQVTVVSSSASGWGEPTEVIPVPANANAFTNDGYILIDGDKNKTRTYRSSVSISGKTKEDLLAFPFTVHGVNDPSLILIKLTILYKNVSGAEFSSELERRIIAVTGGYKIEGDSDRNIVTSLTDTLSGAAIPFLWQARLKDFTNSETLVAYGGRIYEVEIAVDGVTPDGSTYVLACGSIKFTPDTLSNFYRITTGYRKLLRVLYKTNRQAYVNAEYRILGV